MFGRSGIAQVVGEMQQCREQLAQQEVRLENLLQQLAEERAEVRRLTDVLVQMKRDGFNLPPQSETREKDPAPELSAAVLTAIQSRARAGSDLYGQLVDDAWHMLTVENRPESEVIRITKYGAAGMRDEEDEWK